MATLRRLQAITARNDVRTLASHWLSVILGAYVSIQLVLPSISVG